MPSLSLFYAILLSFSIFTKALANQPELPPAPVEITKPQQTLMVKGVVSTGELFANHAIVLKSEVPGKIIRINLPEGKEIAAGSILIELDDSVAKAQLQQAVAKHEHSLLRYNRIRALIEKGNTSPSEQDDALATLRFDEANVALAKAQLEKTKIKAPFSGMLGLRRVDIGDYINPGDALINLDDVHELLVDFSIPEKYFAELKTGQSIEVTLPALPKARFVGKIIALSPKINHITHSIQARASLLNKDNVLRPGLFAKVKVIFNQNPRALVLPEQAVFSTQGKHFIYAVQNNQALLQEVKTGVRENGQIEILNGVALNDSIVKSGHMKLYNGAKVFEVKP